MLMQLGGAYTASAPPSGNNNTYIPGAPSYAQPAATRPTAGPGLMPAVGRVSQEYGRPSSGYAAGYHTGTDIGAAYGSAVVTPGAGDVIFAGWYGAYGWAVKVRTGDGTVHLFAHLSRVGVKVGQRLTAGSYIGAVGNSGNSNGAHLHWEVRTAADRYGQGMDPLAWLKRQTSPGLASQPITGYTGGPLTVAQLKHAAMQAGFSASTASLMAAIAMAESGGNPRAFNGNSSTGDLSYGLWQINMIGRMGPERLRLFGIPNNDALYDPVVNARAAFRIFQSQGLAAWSVFRSGAYKKYIGAANAAVPQPIPASTGGGGGGGGGGTGMEYLAALAARATPDQLAAGAGFSVAFFKSDPELWGLLQSALKRGDTDAGNLLAAIKQSNWWRTHAEADRQMLAMQASDPAQYARLMDEKRLSIRQMAGGLGGTIADAEVEKLARLALHGGWSEGKITAFLVDTINIKAILSSGADIGGRAGELQDAFGQWAGQYGAKVSNATLADYVTRVLKGEATPQDFLSFAQKQAKALYPHLGDEIDKGMTLFDIASPYMQAAAQLLEQSPDAVSLDNAFIQKALRGDGGQMMSMQDFEESIRRSPDWQTTDNARAAYDQFGREVLKSFGFAW